MLVALAKTLDRRRVVPTVVCLKDAGGLASELGEARVRLYCNLLRNKFDAFVICRLLRLIRRESIDAICVVPAGGDRMFWSTLAGRLAGIPCIVWSQFYPRLGFSGFERSNRVLLRCVERVVALGGRHRLALIRRERIPPGRVVVVRNAIAPEEFDRPEWRGEARRRLGVPADDTVAIGMVANLRVEKRHDVFIEAAKVLAGRYPHTVFYLIGGGTEEAVVRGWMAGSGLSGDRLRLLGPRDDLPVLMQGLDIVCLCSEWGECQSIAMLEAMAAGKAFVGPDIGSLDEALIDGLTGLTVQPADVPSLTAALERLIVNPAERNLLGQRARAKVFAEFRVEEMARQFEDLIETACDSRVTNRPGMVQKRGLTSEPTLDDDPENGFRRGACPRF